MSPSPAPRTPATPPRPVVVAVPTASAVTAEQLADAGRIRREAAGVLRDLTRMRTRRCAGRGIAPADVELVAGRIAALQEHIGRAERHPGMGPDVRAAQRSIHRALLVSTELLGLA